MFSSALGASNIDTIQGFSHVDDVILLDDDIFTKAGPVGALSAGFFRAGTAAQDANDRIISDASTNSLFYDADGIGRVAQIQFATITGIVGGLTTADFPPSSRKCVCAALIAATALGRASPDSPPEQNRTRPPSERVFA